MRAIKLSGTVLLTLAALGCGVRAPAYAYTGFLIGYQEPWIAFDEPPALVELEPGIYVVHDHPAPVYYVDGDYWQYHQGVWYRATSWNRAWEPVHVDLVPGRVAYRDHWRYVHYRPARALVHRQ